MSDTTLGSLIVGKGERDAIHVALAPVTTREHLKPGQHVGFVREYDTDVIGVCPNPIGIVDPFLEHTVKPGDRFYVVLYQNTVTGMKHQWEHPAFASAPKEASIKWLQELADEISMDYRDLLDYISDGSIYTGSEDNSGCRDSEDIKMHYENATGAKAPREVYFRCAC